MLEYLVSAIVVICAKKSHFRSYAGTVRKQSDAACGFLAFVPREHSFHCQCCKLKTMFTGRYPLTQSDIEQMYDLVQTSDQGVNKKRCFAGPDTMNKSWLETSCQVRGSLGCSDHEIMELKALRGGNRAKSMTRALDFRRLKCSLFRDLLGRILWNMAPERRGVQERWVLRKGQSQRVGNQAKMAGGLYG